MSKKKDRADEQAAQAAPGVHSPSPAPGSPAQAAGEGAPGEADAAVQPGGAGEGSVDRAAALEAEVADLRDKLLRKTADFDNFRKRMIREREESSRYANAALLTDVIATIDDFERAIRSAEEARDFSSFLQGVSMIERQLLETLESRWGLKRFASAGESFDPNRHEAVLREEGPPDAKPTVVEDYQKGYYLHERVLRPARVKVMVPGPGQEAVPPAAAPSPDRGNA
jgi:molecular chaperone GrpE